MDVKFKERENDMIMEHLEMERFSINKITVREVSGLNLCFFLCLNVLCQDSLGAYCHLDLGSTMTFSVYSSLTTMILN